MVKHLTLDESIVQAAIDRALTLDGGMDFYAALRFSMKEQVIARAEQEGIRVAHDLTIARIDTNKPIFTELSVIKVKAKERWQQDRTIDLHNCLGYGINDYSCYALNWLHPEARNSPSLKSMIKMKKPPFILGNLCFVLKNVNYDSIVIDAEWPFSLIGYSHELGPRKRKPNFCLWGIYIDQEYLKNEYRPYQCKCKRSMLKEIVIDIHKVAFVCKTCGKMYICTCFKEVIKDDLQFNRNYKYSFRHGICHLCTKTTPIHNYGHPMYYSEFMQKYLPYLEVYKSRYPDVSSQEVENIMRVDLGYPKIGEKWISETILYKIICECFPNDEVIFHARPDWLNGLELDIYLPERKIGVEYQGIQHYKPVKHWGGEESLAKVKQRDALKAKICMAQGISLVYFTYHEDISPPLVRERLSQAIQ